VSHRLLCAALLGAALGWGTAGGGEPEAAKPEQELASGDRDRVEKVSKQLVQSYVLKGLKDVAPLAPAILTAWEKHSDVRDLDALLRLVPLPKDAELRRKLTGLLDAAVKAGDGKKVSTLILAAGSCGEDGAPFIPFMFWALQHKDPVCRQAGLAALARMGKPAAAQAGGAVAQLAGTDKDCQLLALVALIRMGQNVSRATLEAALKAQKYEQAMAIEAVILDEQVKPLLLSADRRVQYLAWSALSGYVGGAKDRNQTVLRFPPAIHTVVDTDPQTVVLAQAEWIKTNGKTVIDQGGDAWEAAISARNGAIDLEKRAAEKRQKENAGGKGGKDF